MNTPDAIGFIAALVCAISMIPQVIKVFITKKTNDLSLGAFSTLASGLFIWIVYGIMVDKTPIIAGNSVAFALTIFIVIMKVRHG